MNMIKYYVPSMGMTKENPIFFNDNETNFYGHLPDVVAQHFWYRELGNEIPLHEWPLLFVISHEITRNHWSEWEEFETEVHFDPQFFSKKL